MRRVDWLFRQPVAVLVLETGANDGLRGLDPDSLRANIEATVRLARRQSSRRRRSCSSAWRRRRIWAREYAARFRGAYQAAARDLGRAPGAVRAAGGRRRRLAQPGGRHPPDRGWPADRLAATVWAALRPMLTRGGSASMKILAFSASLRRGSLNGRLIALAVAAARRAGAEVDLADFHEFAMPSYDADVHAAGMPSGAEAFARRVESAQGLLISSPEYNYSMPGHLKNAIDWISRRRPNPLRGRSALLLSASNSPAGGIRGFWQLRIPLEGNGVFVFPDMFWLSAAESAFTAGGSLRGPEAASGLDALVPATFGRRRRWPPDRGASAPRACRTCRRGSGRSAGR